jgi:hypothetical protein
VRSSTCRLITFDKLSNATSKNEAGPLPDSYENLRWNNVWYMHEQWVKTNHTLSGWHQAFNNGHVCVAFNGKGDTMSIHSSQRANRTFSLISFEGTAAWHDDLVVKLTGRHQKEDVHSTSIVLQFNVASVFHLNWKNIDEIQFAPVSGKAHQGTEQYSQKYFALTWILIQ